MQTELSIFDNDEAAAADATKLYVEGSAVEQYYWVDYVKVTKDNASEYVK